MAEEELKNLPPEERIKRLKELEEKKKKEIEEAQKLIRDSEVEITEKRKFKDKVPLPQVASLDLHNLTREEKDVVLRAQGKRYIKKSEEEGTTKSEEKRKKNNRSVEEVLEAAEKKDKSLEETLGGAGVGGKSYTEEAEFQRANADYVARMAQKPMASLYQEAANINREVEEKGYINREEEQRIAYLSSAVERKLEDVESGRYTLSEQAALAVNATKQLSEKLRAMYR